MDALSPKWAGRFLRKAKAWAEECSKDPSSKVGAIVVSDTGRTLSEGFNGIPEGVNDLPERIEVRPDKYLWMAHAEENAIVNAAAEGVRLRGATMFTTHHPCSRCAGMIVGAKIKCVVVGDGVTKMPPEEVFVARTKLAEAGVLVINHGRFE